MTRSTPEFEDAFARLIALPSVSSIDPHHDQSNRAVIDALAEWFHALDFQCDVICVDDASGKYNLVARRGNDANGGLVLSGHTDTVPYDASGWNTDPFTLTKKDGNYYGLGTADMKSYFPIILETLERLQHVEFVKPITLVATADEESTMSGARLLSNQLVSGDYCIIGEPTGLKPVYAHKGIIIESFRLLGRSGHSSNPALGNSAMEGMHRVMTALMEWRQQLQEEHVDDAFVVPVPTMNFGRIEGGDSPNRICAQCELSLDLRMMPGMDASQLRQQLRDHISEALKNSGLKLEFTGKVDIVPPMLTSQESEIVSMCESITGNTAGCVTFGTEGPFFNDLGIPTVILGPGDIDVAHQPNEYLQIHRIEPMITILSKLLLHFCGGEK